MGNAATAPRRPPPGFWLAIAILLTILTMAWITPALAGLR
jgi:hypothetical protein